MFRAQTCDVVRRVCSSFAAMLLLSAGCNGHRDVIGKYQLTSISGRSVNAAASEVVLELQDGGKYTANPDEIGTWSVEGDAVVMHKEKYKGKTKAERAQFITQQGRMTTENTAAFEDFWKDMKAEIGTDHKTLTIHRQNMEVVLTKLP